MNIFRRFCKLLDVKVLSNKCVLEGKAATVVDSDGTRWLRCCEEFRFATPCQWSWHIIAMECYGYEAKDPMLKTKRWCLYQLLARRTDPAIRGFMTCYGAKVNLPVRCGCAIDTCSGGYGYRKGCHVWSIVEPIMIHTTICLSTKRVAYYQTLVLSMIIYSTLIQNLFHFHQHTYRIINHTKICFFVKRRSTIGKHTLSQSKTPGHRSQSRPVIGKHCCLRTVEGERRAEPWNAYGGRGTVVAWFRRFCFLAFFGRVFSHGFWKCWVGWEIDSRCRVKLGKGGIYEQNNLVFLKGNMQWQTTHTDSDVADAKDFWKALRQLLQSESWSTAPCLQRTDQMWSHWHWW